MRSRTSPAVRRLLGRRVPVLGGAGPGVDDAVRAAAALLAGGVTVALEHVPVPGPADPATELRDLVAGVAAAGLAAGCELTVPVDLLGADPAEKLGVMASDAGLKVALAGSPDRVRGLHARLPAAGVVVSAGWRGAEDHCRDLAGGRVRLTGGRGAAADLTFVRCLNVLMAGSGRPGIGTTDPRLVAIAGERAAWNDRTPDSWEYVMPWGIRAEQQRRLVAGGYRVRIAVPWGEGAAVAGLRRLAGRS